MVSNKTIKIIVITIIIIIILAGGIVFFLLQPKKTISPISSKPQDSKNVIVSDNLPSKALKVYVDDSGFSFKYPDDVSVNKKEVKSDTIYVDLELTSYTLQAKGSISIKVLDTKLKSVDEWFIENKVATSSTIKATVRSIKIGDLSGQEIKDVNRLMAGAIDQNVLFSIEVISYDKYWLDVYNTILSSFNFVSQQSKIETDNILLDDSNGSDVILEEETIE